MTVEKDFKRFLRVGAVVVAAGVAVSMVIVALVDPYRLYGLAEIAGVNRIKPAPTRYQSQIKLHGALAHKANVFILGNSRAELGLNPEHPSFGRERASAYNLALAGTRLSTARNQLRQLDGEGLRPRRIVIGAEFLDFLVAPDSPGRTPDPAGALGDVGWQFDALFSIDSLVDSLKTLRLQKATNPPSITARGFNPLLEYNTFAQQDGYYPIFQQRALENAKRLVKAPHALMLGGSGNSPDLEDLRAVLDYAVRQDAEVHVIVYPYHAQLMAMFEATGLDKPLEAWKTLLAHELLAIRTRYPDANITLWDFSGFSQIQCEPIPAKGDRLTQTKWYWEAGHFKPALGDLMLARMHGGEAPHGLGVKLEPGNLALNRARIAREREQCIAAQPGIFADARALVAAARSASVPLR